MPTPTEDKFILHWRALDCGHVCSPAELAAYKAYSGFKLSTWDSFENGRLIEAIGGCYALTPRGRDLLATADAIGYDPSAKPELAPKTKPCPDCAGVGRKLLGIARQGADPEHVCELDYTCTTCKGRREVPCPVFNTISEAQAREYIDSVMQVNGLTRRCVEYLPSPGQNLAGDAISPSQPNPCEIEIARRDRANK